MTTAKKRVGFVIQGSVQGVGFRPFVYRLARQLDLAGWVSNSSRGVFIELEGNDAAIDTFLARLRAEKPPLSAIRSITSEILEPKGESEFKIIESDGSGDKTALLLPDVATCGDCLREIFDPADRRYLYPFANCTNCGPRFTIILALPYDRDHTTMKKFPMCERCRSEYGDPLNRRFHAQPNACPDCGPHLELWDREGHILSLRHEAVRQTAAAIQGGAIVAVKGLGGFHLMVNAQNERAVAELRRRKHRESKPFALMYPGLEAVERDCAVTEAEKKLLVSPPAPIVLLRRKANSPARSIAPRNPYLGVMLPYTPLHHILLKEIGVPVVATSGNLSEEPICTDETEAAARLGKIADLFLVHNRPIAQHADDSVVRVVMDEPLTLRCARGYAPLAIEGRTMPPLCAVGSHLKNTVAISVRDNMLVSQHIGDLDSDATYRVFERTGELLRRVYELAPQAVASDLHPDYLSSRFARKLGIPRFTVQHHYAHVLSLMAEHDLKAPLLGISWDGTGYGADGTIWGGEFLKITERSFVRLAHLRSFSLPGGEKAIHEPKRAALGLLYEIYGSGVFAMRSLPLIAELSPQESKIFSAMLAGGVNTPRTTSAGRLFDAVSAIIGVCRENRFEGQAAMELEFAAEEAKGDKFYSMHLSSGPDYPWVVDWEPMVREIVRELSQTPVPEIAAGFHHALARAISAVAQKSGIAGVALTGGCFQNKYLTEAATRELTACDFRVYRHHRVPPNDGGIALGQIMAAAREIGPDRSE